MRRHVAYIEADLVSLRRGGTTRTAICTCRWRGPARGTLELAAERCPGARALRSCRREKGGVRAMTKYQAWTEATRRWSSRGDFGAGGQVCLRTKKHANRCLVGYLLWKDEKHLKCDPLLIGEGPTWEAAFANADAREAQRLPPLRAGFL